VGDKKSQSSRERLKKNEKMREREREGKKEKEREGEREQNREGEECVHISYVSIFRCQFIKPDEIHYLFKFGMNLHLTSLLCRCAEGRSPFLLCPHSHSRSLLLPTLPLLLRSCSRSFHTCSGFCSRFHGPECLIITYSAYQPQRKRCEYQRDVGAGGRDPKKQK